MNSGHKTRLELVEDLVIEKMQRIKELEAQLDLSASESMAAAISALTERLRAKGDMHAPDGEWLAIRAAITALEAARDALGETGRTNAETQEGGR